VAASKKERRKTSLALNYLDMGKITEKDVVP